MLVSTLQARGLILITNTSIVMSRGQFKVGTTESDGDTSDIQLKMIAYHEPIGNIQQNDTDLGNALVRRSPVAVQTPQGSSEEGAVDRRKLVLEVESEEVRKATAAVVTAGDTAAGPGVRGVVVHVQVEARVKHTLEIEEMPDGSITIHHIAAAERRVYAAIFESLYLSAIESPEDVADEEPTIADRCVDQCCQACVCKFSRRPQDLLHTDEVMTHTLRRGRQKGWGMFFQFTFPLVTNVVRDIWVTTEFIFTIIATVLSSIMFTHGNDAAFNLVHLVLASVSFALATLDFGLNLYDRCKGCYHDGCCKVRPDSEENGTSQLLDDRDAEGDAESSTSYRLLDDTKGDAKSKGKCLRYFKNLFDFCRTWIAELILYPLLICDMLEFITGQGWKNESATDRLGFALFVISSGGLVVYVYIVRLLILFGMIYHVKKGRSIKQEESDSGGDSASAFWFQLYFYIHVFGQMLVQILMLIGIGAKIQNDNPPPNTTVILTNTTDDDSASIYIGPFLWYMIVSGYILPFLGLLTFFIVTYYWVQEFPIGICLDVLRLLIPTTGSADSIRNLKGEIKAPSDKMSRIERYVRYADLNKDFRNMRGKSWFRVKFAYPCKSPMLVFLCIAYFAIQLGFAACAVFTDSIFTADKFDPDVDDYIVFLNGGNWYKFYIAAVVLGLIANWYTFLVAVFWLVMISVVIGAAGPFGFCIVPICCLLAHKDNSTRR